MPASQAWPRAGGGALVGTPAQGWPARGRGAVGVWDDAFAADSIAAGDWTVAQGTWTIVGGELTYLNHQLKQLRFAKPGARRAWRARVRIRGTVRQQGVSVLQAGALRGVEWRVNSQNGHLEVYRVGAGDAQLLDVVGLQGAVTGDFVDLEKDADRLRCRILDGATLAERVIRTVFLVDPDWTDVGPGVDTYAAVTDYNEDPAGGKMDDWHMALLDAETGAAAAGAVFTDDFAVDSLASGLWKVLMGTWVVAGGQLTYSGAQSKYLHFWPSGATQHWKARVRLVNGIGDPGLIARLRMPTNAINHILCRYSGGRAEFYKELPAGSTLLANPAVAAPAVGDYLQLEKNGNDLTLKLLDGALAQRWTYTHTLAGGDVALFGAGVPTYAGVADYNQSGAGRMDDWRLEIL